jgi:putative transposase
MSDYRRWYVPGGTYFFTLVTYRRYPFFQDRFARELLGQTMREVKKELPFETIAAVLLWDHLHCIWTLPSGDADYSTRWKRVKGEFTRRWLDAGGMELPVTASRRARGERGVWQRRFWEHTALEEEDIEVRFDYIHYNPVKHGYVKRPGDWTWSTFGRYVALGHYEEDWGSTDLPHLQGLQFE